jgi:hypothetical protein
VIGTLRGKLAVDRHLAVTGHAGARNRFLCARLVRRTLFRILLRKVGPLFFERFART